MVTFKLNIFMWTGLIQKWWKINERSAVTILFENKQILPEASSFLWQVDDK